MTDLTKTRLNAGDIVQLVSPRSEMEEQLHDRDSNRHYKVLSFYTGLRQDTYVRCLDLGKDGSIYGVWHFHAEALARVREEVQDD